MSLYICEPLLHRTCPHRLDRKVCQVQCKLTTVMEFSVDCRALSEAESDAIADEIRQRLEPKIKIGKKGGNNG